jgi:uncharacterized protein (TIGR02996 family)
MAGRKLTEEWVYEVAPNAKAAQAGLDLVRKDRFSVPQWSADRTWLTARCQGSEPEPYRVRVDLLGEFRPETECTCSSYQQPCKHALGLMLLAIRRPELFTETELNAKYQKKREGKSTAEEEEKTPDPETVREAFLEDILAHPSDTAPRLIYADWLDEHGDRKEDADRARFIRIQCRLAEEPPPAPADPIRKEAEQLWEKHRKEWLAGLPVGLRKTAGVSLTFSRGFLEELQVPMRAFVRHGEAVAEEHPLHRLRITDPIHRDWATQFAQLRALSKLRSLDLSGLGLGVPQELKLVLNTPFLSNLERLDLGTNGITHAGIRALVGIEYLAGLRELDLRGNQIGDAGVELLAAWPLTANLRVLGLRGNSVSNKGAQALAQSPHLGNIERLGLQETKISDGGAAVLSERFKDRVLLV